MQAKDLMTRTVTCISPETRIQDAAKTMKAMDVGFLAVCEKDRLVGAVTDRDVVLRVIAEGKDVKDCRARDVMTHDIFWCFEDQTADEVADYMAEKEIRRVLLLDRNKRLVGVISIGDLAKGAEEHVTGKTIKDISAAPTAKAA
jgi:CBS domain-containing protein